MTAPSALKPSTPASTSASGSDPGSKPEEGGASAPHSCSFASRADALGGFESALGYTFEDPELLAQALRHRSYLAEAGGSGPSNERLEFLGDSVLGMVITEYIYMHYPGLAEGKMTKLRASAVGRGALHEVAEEIGLGGHLMLGKGEEASGGRDRASILADAMEAVLAAVYLDGGPEEVRRLILERWEERIQRRADAPGWNDYKSRLQERLAQRGGRPCYRVAESGPDHEKLFTASVFVEGAERGSGTGRSKREAEQSAARRALDELAGGSGESAARAGGQGRGG